MEKVVIELKNRMAVLILQPFDGDIDTESLLKIDYANILGEILTFPVLFNKIANLKAEVANILAVAKLDLDIFEAQMHEEYQNKLYASSEKKPTIKDVESAILRDARYRKKREWYYSKQKDFDYLDGLYWAGQSKDTKLNRLSEKIRPEDFEKDLLEGTINGIQIKMVKKQIK